MIDTRYGLRDYCQLSLWYISGIALVKWYGCLGVFMYLGMTQALYYILYYGFGVEMMSGGDEIFFLDDERSCMNIVTALTCEKFKAEEFRNQMFERSIRHPRVRGTVIKLFGKFMFKIQSKEYMYENIDKCCKVLTDIHTEKDLADFLAKDQSIREPLDFVQWRQYYVPDFNETESVFIFKCHHSFTDGVGLIMGMHS